MTSKVYVMRGLPGSGKSTIARKLCADTGAFRLNMDDIRSMLGFGNGTDRWSHENEAVAFELQLNSLVNLVKAGHDVVIDNTHIRKEWLIKYRKALRFFDVQFQMVDCTMVPLDTCLERNEVRPEGEFVPPDAIKKMARTLAGQKGKPVSGEWLNEGVGLPVVEPYVPDIRRPKAILVDLDGTLYEHVARTPYQYDLVYTDRVFKHILEIVNLYHKAGYKILLASGRPDSCMTDTRRALARDYVPVHALWMRKTGDDRADLHVKLDIFNENIRRYYNVVLSLDDRDQVVDLYRNMLKLPTLQVANGNF